MARKSGAFTNCDTALDDVALIAFTSGTTGPAKGTVHYHRDVMAICDCFPRSTLKPTQDDVFCGSPPLAFTFGLGGLALFPMRFGASTALAEKAAPDLLPQIIYDHKASIVFTAPTAYRVMADNADSKHLASLRKGVSAGEHLPLAIYEAWRKKTGIKLIDGLGSTEMLHIFISTAGDDIRPGATGKAIPGYEAMIVDEAGQKLPPGEVGRLAVRGPTGCRYLDDPERQRKYVQDGWNLTGDAYKMDADGYFWYQARSDDMIISAGYNISGPEVEGVLLEHPKVRECAVVGAPDGERGMVVKAFVILRDIKHTGAETMKELQDFVKAQIAPYKYPRQVEFVEALPRTETGKVQRFKLREQEKQKNG
jgi:2-aminobenzoate-CoA ligase